MSHATIAFWVVLQCAVMQEICSERTRSRGGTQVGHCPGTMHAYRFKNLAEPGQKGKHGKAIARFVREGSAVNAEPGENPKFQDGQPAQGAVVLNLWAAADYNGALRLKTPDLCDWMGMPSVEFVGTERAVTNADAQEIIEWFPSQSISYLSIGGHGKGDVLDWGNTEHNSSLASNDPQSRALLQAIGKTLAPGATVFLMSCYAATIVQRYPLIDFVAHAISATAPEGVRVCGSLFALAQEDVVKKGGDSYQWGVEHGSRCVDVKEVAFNDIDVGSIVRLVPDPMDLQALYDDWRDSKLAKVTEVAPGDHRLTVIMEDGIEDLVYEYGKTSRRRVQSVYKIGDTMFVPRRGLGHLAVPQPTSHAPPQKLSKETGAHVAHADEEPPRIWVSFEGTHGSGAPQTIPVALSTVHPVGPSNRGEPQGGKFGHIGDLWYGYNEAHTETMLGVVVGYSHTGPEILTRSNVKATIMSNVEGHFSLVYPLNTVHTAGWRTLRVIRPEDDVVIGLRKGDDRSTRIWGTFVATDNVRGRWFAGEMIEEDHELSEPLPVIIVDTQGQGAGFEKYHIEEVTDIIIAPHQDIVRSSTVEHMRCKPKYRPGSQRADDYELCQDGMCDLETVDAQGKCVEVPPSVMTTNRWLVSLVD